MHTQVAAHLAGACTACMPAGALPAPQLKKDRKVKDPLILRVGAQVMCTVSGGWVGGASLVC